MHRDTGNTESVIVEYGFIDNPRDLEFLKNNYQDLAEAVIKSVLEYKGIPYVAPENEVVDTYKVMKGDTLYGIANKLDTTVDELKKLNGLVSNTLSVGQVLKIPTKVVDIGETEIYQVKSGDTLYSLANKYNITVDEIKKLNDLEGDNLSVGQLLNVPSGLSTANTYIVSSGDTLYSLAKRFDTTPNKIKELNNLTGNLLSIGQKLFIPVVSEKTYTVKKGDTLYGIAREFNTSPDKIKELNNLTSNVLSVGQILIVSEN